MDSEERRGTADEPLHALGRRFEHVAHALSGRAYLTGDAFTIADEYLFVILNWRTGLRFDLDRWPMLLQYQERAAALPAVRAAMKAEGLLA
ncbi:MAG TPA: glutathione binding-like protein [Casimicrobiaceae bacterium]